MELTIIQKLCQQANLPLADKKKVAKKLKENKVIVSIYDFFEEDNTIPELIKTSKGIPIALKENLETILKMHNIKIKYDEILKTEAIESDKYVKNTDNRMNRVIADVKNHCAHQKLSISVVKNYLPAIIDENSFNPMLEMINSKKWDGIDRIKQVVDCIKTNDNQVYAIEVVTRWFIQCVAAWDRAENSPYPDVLPRFENVLTFVGAQGINKTKFFELLMPKEYKKYVGTGIHLDPTNKDSIHLAVGNAITELGELDSTFKKDIAMIKAFLSLSIDKYRRPYAQLESEFARRTSFCASVNDIEFLVDPTGNRRFWPFYIKSIDFSTYLEIDKQQLWAQIYESLYLKGEHWWIDFEHNPEVFEMLTDKHQEHAVINPADEIALEVIEYTQNASETQKNWKNATEIATYFKLPNTGRKNISIIKKKLLNEGIEFNSNTKKFKVCLFNKKESTPAFDDNKYYS